MRRLFLSSTLLLLSSACTPNMTARVSGDVAASFARAGAAPIYSGTPSTAPIFFSDPVLRRDAVDLSYSSAHWIGFCLGSALFGAR